MKGLINIRNDDNKCFLWFHVRHLNCEGKNLCRIIKTDRETAKGLNYSGADFPVPKKDYCKISVMNGININVFCYEEKIVYPVYVSDQCLDLLLISNHYVYKDFNRLMFNKKKCKNKKWFYESCLQCFSSEKLLLEHSKDCLMINGDQKVKLEKGFIEFRNYSKKIPAPSKIYADFECLLKSCDSGINNDCFSYTSKYQDHVPCSFGHRLVFVNDKFSKDVVLYRGKNAVCNLLSVFSKSILIVKCDEKSF